jgi:exosortase
MLPTGQMSRFFTPGSFRRRWRIGGSLRRSLPFAVFGAVWYMLLSRLSPYWAVNPEYSFGWLVPVLSAFLFLLRWRSRPPAGIPNSRLAKWVCVAAGFALMPAWVIAQANPDWRLINWLLASQTVAVTLCAIYFAGGVSWLRHFAFTICLIFTAVPQPHVLEESAAHALTQASTALTVAALQLFQINAVQHGNLVELKTGVIGIDEACSGIRSLQATFMMSLFLGELYRTSVVRRSLLVLAGAAIAFGCNAGRTFLLTTVAAREGLASIANWHDPVGYIVLTACFLSVWGIARVIAGHMPVVIHPAERAPAGYPQRLVLCLGGWVLLTVIGAEIWYRAHDTREPVRWSPVWPIGKQEFADLPISKSEAELLQFDEGRGAEWTNGDGSHWVAYFFRWDKGLTLSRILARWHRPEICFPAAGYKLGGKHGIVTVQANGVSIPFQAMDFEDNGYKAYVFFCLWEDGASSGLPQTEEEMSWSTRLRSVLLGQRNLGQQTLQVVISGYDSPEQAETAFRREVAKLIQARTNALIVATSD